MYGRTEFEHAYGTRVEFKQLILNWLIKVDYNPRENKKFSVVFYMNKWNYDEPGVRWG